MTEPKRSESQLRVLPESVESIIKSPMLAIPPALRPSATRMWLMFRHLPGLETPMPISIALSIWMDQWGLDVRDAEEVLKLLTKPEHVAEIKYGNDLTSRMAQLCSARIERRNAASTDISRFI